MANSARRAAQGQVDESQLRLLYGDDDLTKYWSSSLFNVVYLRHDISEKHPEWKNDDSVDFNKFLNAIRNLCVEYKGNEKELSSWSETETINNWVKNVLNALGWSNNSTGSKNPYLEETSFRYDNKTYRTDILIVDDPEEKKYITQKNGEDKISEARQSVLMPVEVKYWNRLEEFSKGQVEVSTRTDKEIDDITRSTTPNEQTVQYMNVLKKDWGILTDGSRWRLLNLDLSSEDSERYFEFNLFALYQAISTEQSEADSKEIHEASKYFYHFFSKSAFSTHEGVPFVDEVLKYSKKYVNKVEEDLKYRFVKAMNIACNGIYKSAKINDFDQNLATIRNLAESALFNILFIKSLESRSVLPMSSTDYKKISLSSIIDKIEVYDPDKESNLNTKQLERTFKKGNGNSFQYSSAGTELHERILRLTSVINKGASKKDNFGFEICGFKESIFSKNEWSMFNTCKLSNDDWVRILFELGYADSDSLNRSYQQIPYSYFTPRQLGSIYESFLEFKIDKTDRDMIYEKNQWREMDSKSEKFRLSEAPKIRKGELFFTPDNKDRKATGSYYTPDYIVQYIVKQTIAPLTSPLNSKDFLKFKLIDPAMGSGHFLTAAITFLTSEYIRKLEAESPGDVNLTITEAKRIIISNCIYGVDINPRAVKLAKLSLWLSSASSGMILEHLEDQLKTADTLGDSFDWQSEFSEVFTQGGFDAVIGNPPYRREMEFKSLFDSIAQTNIGKKYRSPRMDLWYYFVHKGLEILKSNGKLSFITNSYWTAGSGAEKLVKHIKEETSVDEFVVLGNLKVFAEVSGQHMIFRFSKKIGNQSVIIKSADEKDKSSAECYFKNEKKFTVFIKGQDNIFNNNRVDLEKSNEEFLGLIEKGVELGTLGIVRQGIAENPSTIGKKVNLKFKNKWKTGEGVFSLTPSEVKSLKFDINEKKLLRQYHDLCDIGRFWASGSPSREIIYTTKANCPSLSKYPNLKKHLIRFKEIMDARRETLNGSNEWFHLHWPRDEKIWETKSKILSVQMGKVPTFTSVNYACYVPFSVNVFVPNESAKMAIEYYEGVLNSKVMATWFLHNAKKRGVGLEINGNVLQRAPIVVLDMNNKASRNIHDKLVSAVKLLKLKVEKFREKGMDPDEIELKISLDLIGIDKLVCQIYKIPEQLLNSDAITTERELTEVKKVSRRAA